VQSTLAEELRQKEDLMVENFVRMKAKIIPIQAPTSDAASPAGTAEKVRCCMPTHLHFAASKHLLITHSARRRWTAFRAASARSLACRPSRQSATVRIL